MCSLCEILFLVFAIKRRITRGADVFLVRGVGGGGCGVPMLMMEAMGFVR